MTNITLLLSLPGHNVRQSWLLSCGVCKILVSCQAKLNRQMTHNLLFNLCVTISYQLLSQRATFVTVNTQSRLKYRALHVHVYAGQTGVLTKFWLFPRRGLTALYLQLVRVQHQFTPIQVTLVIRLSFTSPLRVCSCLCVRSADTHTQRGGRGTADQMQSWGKMGCFLTTDPQRSSPLKNEWT